MKKYIKNKNFIPEKFCDKKQVIKNKIEKGVLMLLIGFNLFLLTITTKNIEETHKASAINNVNIEDKSSKNTEIKSINTWIENILNEDVEEAHIDKNKGEIITSNFESFDRLSCNKFLIINDMSSKNDGKYKLGVSLNE